MAVVHNTTMSPGKLELLAAWLPTQPWYRVTGQAPLLAKAGGFRLDDPAGEVGMEFMAVTDSSGPEPTTYHVPLSYRGTPLDAADEALIGTSVHGVLGTRWIYDGTRDSVLIAQVVALLAGRAQAQAQHESDTPDSSVVVTAVDTDTDAATTGFIAADDAQRCTDIAVTAEDAIVRVHRILRPDHARPDHGPGRATAPWRLTADASARGVFLSIGASPR